MSPKSRGWVVAGVGFKPIPEPIFFVLAYETWQGTGPHENPKTRNREARALRFPTTFTPVSAKFRSVIRGV